MEKIKVAVIFGGASSEHEVSRLSASSILENLNTEKFEIYKIGIRKDGSWWLFSGSTSLIPNGEWEASPDNRPCAILPGSSPRGIFLTEENRILSIDVMFPVLHGKNGEDGTIQGLFELSGIPYVGCGVLSSSLCMDKAVTSTLLEAAGIPHAKFVWFYTYEYDKNPDIYLEKCETKLGYPMFVKPANAGSSVGVTKAKDRESLLSAIEIAAKEDTKIMVEENIDGIEVECAVLGNTSPTASVVGEIVSGQDFYTYEAKYLDNTSQLFIPARISKEASDTIRETAVKAFLLLGCSGLSRVDFFVRHSDHKVLLNELNTLPGFTSISMYPKLFAASGLPYPQLLERLISLARQSGR